MCVFPAHLHFDRVSGSVVNLTGIGLSLDRCAWRSNQFSRSMRISSCKLLPHRSREQPEQEAMMRMTWALMSGLYKRWGSQKRSWGAHLSDICSGQGNRSGLLSDEQVWRADPFKRLVCPSVMHLVAATCCRPHLMSHTLWTRAASSSCMAWGAAATTRQQKILETLSSPC